jgi:hypothetical protein
MNNLRARVLIVLALIATTLGAFGSVAAPVALGSPNATVSPRVQCGGFNGHIAWSGWIGSPYIHVWGIVWSSCKSFTTLKVTYSEGTGGGTQEAGVTFGFERDSEGVNYNVEGLGGAPVGYISIRVCSTHPTGRAVCSRPRRV